MKQQLKATRDNAVRKLAQVREQQVLETPRVKYPGKKGEPTSILRQMDGLSAKKRPVIGQLANQARSLIKEELTKRVSELKNQVVQVRLEQEKPDVTLPDKHHELSMKHPLSIVPDEIKEIFVGMGFETVDGSEVEYNYYDLEAPSIPKNRPARDTQDTFYINDDIALYTQISPVQVRVMEKTQPSIRIVLSGCVYRSDAVDTTHSSLSHQIKGLVVGEGITFANLRDTFETFVKRLYGEGPIVRSRPHHFPFTEPSVEVDVQYFNCRGEGCRLCRDEGWIEASGCGMIHLKVFSNCGTDPEAYSSSTLGMGLERVAMRRYNIGDLRLFYENDIRFLRQFQETSSE